jgi:4-amino-4-deoxy-L-arabinose transferase-like glycosyltransferase
MSPSASRSAATRSRAARADPAAPPAASLMRTLAPIVLASMLLGALMMTRDHSWGDDFAAYILQARSLVQGTMSRYVAQSAFTMAASSHVFGPVTEPWGYPLMLAPVYALFGLRVQALKAVALVCFAAFLIAFFLLARTRLKDTEALLLTAVLGFNVGLLNGTDQILSDIPFALWSTLSLWLMFTMARGEAGFSLRLRHAALVGLAVFAAVFTRVAGFLLFVPLVVSQIQHLRQGADRGLRPVQAAALSAVPYAVFGSLYAIQAWIFPSVGHENPLGPVTLQTVGQNLIGYFWAPAYFLQNILGGAEPLYLILLPFILYSIWRHLQRDLPLHLYIVATLALFISRAGFAEARYLFPIWPLLVLLAFDGMQLAAAQLDRSRSARAQTLIWDFFLVLALLSAAACLRLGWLNLRAGRYDYSEARGAFHPTSTAMFEFIRERTPPDSVIIFFKPRAMRLRTDRDAFFTTRCEDLPRGDYVVIEKSMRGYDQILPQDVMHCNPSVVLTPVYERDQFVVYEIRAAP